MLTFHEALEILKGIDYRMPTESVKLIDSWNRILCEEAVSDIDLPPFDKAAMDGYACRKEDLSKHLKVIGSLFAGSSEKYTLKPGTCVKIMTGTPVPLGADTVMMNEHSEQIDDSHIRFTQAYSKSNICVMGEDVCKGDTLLESGIRILPHHISVLASAGYSQVKVSVVPRVAIISTGNELVEPDQIPGASQIRNSNAYNLSAQLKAMGIEVHYGGIVNDDKQKIQSHILRAIEQYDVIILTGGASQGEHDYVPEVLRENNMKLNFDKLAIQPGKPVSFASGKDKFCFGLSGNPVSSYLQFEVLVKPFLYHLMSHSYQHPIIMSELANKMGRKNAARLKFFPISFNSNGQAEEVPFNGSAHMAGLTEVDGFGLFPKDCEGLDPGDKIEILLIR